MLACSSRICVQPNLEWSFKLINIGLIGIFLLGIRCILGSNHIDNILWGQKRSTSYTLVILVPSRMRRSLVLWHTSWLYLRVALSILFFMFPILRASLDLTLFLFPPFHLWILKGYYNLNLLLSCSRGLSK